ncbi:MAG: undecaprenyl/decaprenyl-phosphate alpha-N-acetylglucosaminyl 1-phosphate transferase [Thermotogae bacterium]|nr:undecaprenyl/decaprenyl-phosphate alpha-N-acetylglucosaminyl 1-phosphate transferase [Thermotogota bacterium]
MDRITIGLIAFIVTMVVTPFAIRFAKKHGLVDVPDKRKIHKIPTPRIGGIGIFAGVLIGISATAFFTKDTWQLWALIPISLIAVMGFVDDVKGLSFKIKFLVQIVASILAVILVGANLSHFNNPFGGGISLGVFGPILAVLWMVGVTNAINLTDGLDGLASGVSAISAFTIAVTSSRVNVAATLVAISVFASSMAFLRYNFHPAKTFMGDTGSQLLGFTLALIAIKGASISASTLSLAVPLLALGVPILDTVYAFGRRILGGHNPFLPDKMHIHHQLLEIGFSQITAVLFMYAVSILFSIIAVTYSGIHELTAIAFYIIIGILLISFLWVMRKRRAKNGRRVENQVDKDKSDR